MTNVDDPMTIERFDEPKPRGLVEVMLLAASADGDFSPDERARLLRNVTTLTSRRIEEHALPGLIDELGARLTTEGRAARLAALKDTLGDPPSRRVALDLALQVMVSDGIVRTGELELILEIAEALEIDRDEAGDMVRAATGGG